MAKAKMGDVVVLLPGILGSVLQRNGEDVWALSGGAMLQGLFSLGRSVNALALGEDDPEKPDLGDGVSAPRLIPDVHLIPGFWKIDGYSKIKQVMFERFELREGSNWFELPYDWRRDNRAAAHRLAAEAPRWLAAWRERSGNPGAKLVLMGHSMGGLVARYYLECLDGWKDTRHLITFGTPYYGSVNAVEFLVNGFQKAFGLFDLSAFLRSLTSVYQLLPVYPCIAQGAGVVDVAAANLPQVEAAKMTSAQGFHGEIANAVKRHLDDEQYRRERYKIHPIVGIFQPTKQSARLDGGKLVTMESLEGEDYSGDGTVPRRSAVPEEVLEDDVEIYAAERHASLQNVDACLVNVYGRLTQKPVGGVRDTPFDGFSLRLSDQYLPKEPIHATAQTAGAAAAIVVTVEDVGTHRIVRRRTVKRRRDDSFAIELAPIPAGVYRLRVAADDPGLAMRDVHDLFVVAGKGSSGSRRAPRKKKR